MNSTTALLISLAAKNCAYAKLWLVSLRQQLTFCHFEGLEFSEKSCDDFIT